MQNEGHKTALVFAAFSPFVPWASLTKPYYVRYRIDEIINYKEYEHFNYLFAFISNININKQSNKIHCKGTVKYTKCFTVYNSK